MISFNSDKLRHNYYWSAHTCVVAVFEIENKMNSWTECQEAKVHRHIITSTDLRHQTPASLASTPFLLVEYDHHERWSNPRWSFRSLAGGHDACRKSSLGISLACSWNMEYFYLDVVQRTLPIERPRLNPHHSKSFCKPPECKAFAP